jgi:arylsulfatase A-like enzyme
MRPEFVAPLLLAILATASGFSRDCLAEKARPNVLIVVADDLGWGHVGWQNPKVITPHLDRLAGDGVKLSQHYVAPVCSPTRVSLMTGRYWSRFGVLGAIRSEPTSAQRAMPPGTTTIATVMKASGYRTAMIGKWHLGAQVEDGPEQFGFDHFHGIRVGGCTPLTHKWLGMGPSVLWDNHDVIKRNGHITDVFGDAAVQWLTDDSDKPFFMILSFTSPHVPLLEPKKWMDLYKDTAPDQSHQLYWAAISHLDDVVGRVLTRIETLGQRENTIVVFFGDNGSPGQPNLMQAKVDQDQYLDVRLPGTNAPLRGKKGDLYEGGIRTPTFFTWPAELQARTCNVPVHVVDWAPTFASLVGYTPSNDLNWDGRDISQYLSDRHLAEAATDVAFYTSQHRGYAIRFGDWKLVQRRDGQPELYNLVEDVREETNVAAKHPDIVKRLQKLKKAAAARDNDAAPAAR